MTYSRNHASASQTRPDPDPQPRLPWDEIAPSDGAGVAHEAALHPAETPLNRPVDLPGRNPQDHASASQTRPDPDPLPTAPLGRDHAGASSWCGRGRSRVRRRFGTFRDANVAIYVMKLNGRSYAASLVPVACPRCGGWHLTQERSRG